MNDIINGYPNIFEIGVRATRQAASKPVYAPRSRNQYDQVQAGFGFALHMHQPTIPAGSDDLANAPLISNLQHMMEHPDVGDNHNATVFMQCYARMSDLIREYVDAGKNPRVMLDYSGNLLWGLRQMEGGRVLDHLRPIVCDEKYYPYVEWLGTMWSHAVVTSTPVPDIKAHMLAWRSHFAAIFGQEAEQRVLGFSPPEMHLPIHPDVCYAYVKALLDCGYRWVMIQEHSIENMDGSGIRRPHLPHRLVAKNSLGETAQIAALVKTQGSDTKLVAQMQPYYEAKTLSRQDLAGKNIPPFVCQIGDGENGGVMMNEYPPAFRQAFDQISTAGVVGFNGSEYLEFLDQQGLTLEDFIPVQPVSQHRIWKEFKDSRPGAADEAIARVHEQDSNFNMDKGSWTSDRSWVKGYEGVLDPMNKLSAAFHDAFDEGQPDPQDPRYQRSFLYLLLSQTSCFRYWGEGAWTEYAKEICRRGLDALK